MFIFKTKNKMKLFLSFCLTLLIGGAWADSVKWEVASWDRIMGSHRALISIEENADTVVVSIPWRRQDRNPEQRGLVLVDLTTKEKIRNFAITEFNREEVDLVFEPKTIPGKYALYYLPLQPNPKVRTGQSKYEYLPLTDMADDVFLERIGLDANRYLEVGILENMPRATLVAMQARSAHDNFYPMNVIAKEEEVKALKENYNTDFILFPEDRQYPICMKDYLPIRWIENLPKKSFSADVEKGEYFAFQVGVFASKKAVKNLNITWDDLKYDGQIIKADAMEIINRDIVDIYGKKSTKSISVAKDKVQALWFVVAIPEDAKSGNYTTTLKFADGNAKQIITLSLNVKEGEALPFNGTLDSWRMSRIKWLNIPAGLSENIPAPYKAIEVNGDKVTATGKEITFDKTGFPRNIKVFGNEVLAAPVKLDITITDKQIVPIVSSCKVVKENNRVARVVSTSKDNNLSIVNNVRIEYDGYMFFNTVITAEKDIKISDISLNVPYKTNVAKYMMGFDIGRGGLLPDKVNYKWQNRPNNKAWLGNVNAGMRIKLRGDKELEHVWAEYTSEANGIPQSWNNDGKGGAKVTKEANFVKLVAYTGDRVLKKGETLELNFSLLPTPVKPRDEKTYLPPVAWNNRMSFLQVHQNKGLGSNSAVLFHGTDENPCINYPLFKRDAITEWCKAAHKENQKALIYYKIGELTNFATEFMVLKSLNDEIFDTTGNGVGDSYLMEHLDGNFTARWCATPWGDNALFDGSVMLNGGTRWENFYINSLEIFLKECRIDGLYFDGMGYSRYFMQRIRSLANEHHKNFHLDFHCGNTITRRSNSYLDVMEHLPYFDTTWIGEGFNYNLGPDFYLVELSGIPFGVPNSMLQYGGNPWRGMLYGMTNRPLGNHSANPSHLWNFFDKVKMGSARMIGYWEEKKCPAATDNKDTLCTVYKFPDNRAIIAVATWDSVDVKCKVNVDWKKLGIDPAKSVIYTPQIPGFQDERFFDLSKEITVPGGKGFLIMVEPKQTQKELITNFDTIADGKKSSMSHGKVSMTAPEAGTVNLSDNALNINAKFFSTAFVEIPIPENAIGVSCKMRIKNPVVRRPHDWHERYDGLNSHGIGVYCTDQKNYFRLHESSYGVWGIDDRVFDHMYVVDSNLRSHAKDGEFYIRIYWNDDYVVAESSLDGKVWSMLYALQRSLMPGDFKTVKLGKMPKSYGWPRTVKEEVKGNDQEADYYDLTFYYKK